MVSGLRQRDFIRDTFGRYISKDVVDTLLDSPDGLKLGGERREITLLVSDLRGFTSLAGRLPPEDVIRILNRYLERVVEILTRYRGTVDEFQGDGILAFFGAPLAGDDDAARAVACAIEMQRALITLNEEHVESLLHGDESSATTCAPRGRKRSRPAPPCPPGSTRVERAHAPPPRPPARVRRLVRAKARSRPRRC